MNAEQMMDAVYARVGSDQRDTRLTPQQVLSFINAGLNAYEVEADWPWLQATASISAVANTDSYALPSGFIGVTGLYRNDTGEPLRHVSYSDLRERWYSAGVGAPQDFAIQGDQLQIRPTPDGSYTLSLTYQRNEPTLTSSSDTPLVPESFHPAIVEYASALAHRLDHQEPRGDVAMKEYQSWLGRLKDNRRRWRGPSRINTRPW